MYATYLSINLLHNIMTTIAAAKYTVYNTGNNFRGFTRYCFMLTGNQPQWLLHSASKNFLPSYILEFWHSQSINFNLYIICLYLTVYIAISVIKMSLCYTNTLFLSVDTI